MIKQVKGQLDGSKLKFAIITASFNEIVTRKLSDASIDCLLRHGVDKDDIIEYKVPGAFEISLVAQKLAEKQKFNAIICNGAVIRGETPHFDQVVNAVTSGVNQVGLKYNLPIIFGVLTTDTVEQALNRSGLKSGNKGWDCALVALEMANLMKSID